MALYNPLSVGTASTGAATASATIVASANTDTVLLAANAARKGSTIYNSSTSRLRVALGATVSATSFTALLEGGGYYETPFAFNGTIHGIWETANGNALITELT